MRDLRDPKLLGEMTLELRRGWPDLQLSQTYDISNSTLRLSPNYNANPSCIEKYGRPQDLPETPF